MPFTNIIENLAQTKQVYSKEKILEMKVKPRPSPKDLGAREHLKTPWNFKNSVFRDYKPDNAALLNKCFEVDWENSKLPKFLAKDEHERETIKNLLRSNYALFRETYKYLSGIDPQKELFCIGVNVFSDTVQTYMPGLIDNQKLKLSDLDLEFIATNAGGK